MKRAGFFARIAQACAVPAALALDRALPAAQSAEMTVAQGDAQLGNFVGRIANISGELSPSGAANLMERGFTDYVEHYGDGATSLIRSLASLAR